MKINQNPSMKKLFKNLAKLLKAPTQRISLLNEDYGKEELKSLQHWEKRYLLVPNLWKHLSNRARFQQLLPENKKIKATVKRIFAHT